MKVNYYILGSTLIIIVLLIVFSLFNVLHKPKNSEEVVAIESPDKIYSANLYIKDEGAAGSSSGITLSLSNDSSSATTIAYGGPATFDHDSITWTGIRTLKIVYGASRPDVEWIKTWHDVKIDYVSDFSKTSQNEVSF